MVFCHVTTRIQTDKHQNLLQQKGGRGFPYLVFMSAEGEVLQQPAGRSVEAFRTTGKYLSIKAKVEGGDESLKTELFVLEVEMGNISPADAAAQRGDHELTEEQGKRLDAALVNGKVLQTLQGMGRDEEKQYQAGKEFSKMLAAGQLPTEERLLPGFYQIIMGAAERDKDAASYEKALNWMRDFINKNYPNDQRAKQYITQWEATLAKLKEEGEGGTDDGQ